MLIINFIRLLLFLPLFALNKFLVIYSKIISLFDPNGQECQLEEMHQKQIDIKINKKLNKRNLNYRSKLISKKKFLFTL